MIINEMPKTIPNYSYCKIYKIVSNQTDEKYIGSTCQKYLCNRMVQHKQNYKRYLGGNKKYVTSYEILKYDDAKIVLIQAYPECKSKEEQHMREQEWLDKLDCVNKKRAYTTIEEAKRIQKEYVKNNFEKIQKYKKEWEINNPEKIKEYRKNNAEKNKAYRSVKIECECGTIITRSHIADHRKRPIHLNNLLKTTNCFS